MATLPRFPLAAGVVALAAAAAATWWLNRPESAAAQQQTDDAYVQADFTVVAPQVAGVIDSLDVREHQAVAAGARLLSIDDRSQRVALDSAKARIEAAQAAVSGLQAQLLRQRSTIAQARAALAADEASLKLADVDRRRFANLARDGAGSVQSQQQAQAHWEAQQAALARDQAGLRAAEEQVDVLQADVARARAEQLAAKAQLAAAELNLSYTRVTAPVAGVVAQRHARVGAYVRPGEPLLTLVPLDALYIEANFRETQLAQVRVGQPVTVSVDALPGVQLKGHVDSLAPASGVSFSTLPAHNATGNFTKIVQRLPVRIALEPGQDGLSQLRVGMSVRPQINVSQAADAVREKGRG